MNNIKNKSIMYLALLLTSISHATNYESGSYIGISFEELKNRTIVTYNPKTEQLNQNKYFIKDGQISKSNDKFIYPRNVLPTNEISLMKYKFYMKEIGCTDYYALKCIKKHIPTKQYFDYDGKKVYILPSKVSKIYDIITKYN